MPDILQSCSFCQLLSLVTMKLGSREAGPELIGTRASAAFRDAVQSSAPWAAGWSYWCGRISESSRVTWRLRALL